nr:hypothetical protein [uncultured Dubosiella sp.]
MNTYRTPRLDKAMPAVLIQRRERVETAVLALDAYRAVEYIQYLHNEGVPLVKKGEQTYSVPTLEELKNVLPDKVFSSFHKN